MAHPDRITTIAGLEKQRSALELEQLQLAFQFYDISGQNEVSRVKHLEISQKMAFNAIDLALPSVVAKIKQKNLNKIALVAPLRGGLGLVTADTISHLESRLRNLDLNFNVVPWAVGIKRYPKAGVTKIYFEHGFDIYDNSRTHTIIMDWGIATGLTVADTAKALHDKGGLGYNRMTVIGIAMADEGEQHIRESCPEIDIQIGTRANLNDKKYVHQLALASGGIFRDVRIPKDWGAEMFGMEITGDSDEQKFIQIMNFLQRMATVFPQVEIFALINLGQHYCDENAPNLSSNFVKLAIKYLSGKRTE